MVTCQVIQQSHVRSGFRCSGSCIPAVWMIFSMVIVQLLEEVLLCGRAYGLNAEIQIHEAQYLDFPDMAGLDPVQNSGGLLPISDDTDPRWISDLTQQKADFHVKKIVGLDTRNCLSVH